MTIRIGISGWTYRPWRGVFYPKGLPQRAELAFAAATFPALEINGTFYGLQRPDAFGRWAGDAPKGFVFAIKGSRYITHLLRLKDVEVPLANFLASGLFALGAKLGPILWQLPPSVRFDARRIEAFLDLLPQDLDAAARLARRHDRRVEGRALLEAGANRPLRHALEIRHESFRAPAFVDLLRRHRVALVFADSVDWPYFEDVTADFVYLRLHGSKELYASGYDEKALDRWAARCAAWAAGGEPDDAERVGRKARRRKRDVFVFFDNDAKVRAPFDAMALARRLGVEAERPAVERFLGRGRAAA
jgi:uncharacterized protein YecE (DUF72 family)